MPAGYWVGDWDEYGNPVLEVLEPGLVVVPPITPAPPLPRGAIYVPPPTPADLARFLGWPPFDVEQELSAQAHLQRAELIVMAYVRGRGRNGEHLAPDLAQIVLSVAGRTMANPTGDSRIEAGAFRSSPGQPDFLLHERLVLDNYRRRAA